MITVRSTINLANQSVPNVIPAVQGDTGRSILFSLADFTIPIGATARYFITKPSGLAVYNDATIDGNTVLVDLTAQSLAEYGDCPGQVRISVGDTVVTSFEFILHVEPFRGIDAVESTTETNIFDQAVDDAREAIAEAAEEAEEYISQALDTTLTIPDKAADAKATGDAISDSADAVIAQMRAEIADVYPTETAQGNPATFDDGADGIPVKDLKVSIVPQQDLHGYDKPWAGGAGKNLLQMTVAGIKAANTSGTWSGNAYTLNGVTFSVLVDSDSNVTGVKTSGTANNIVTFGLGSFNAINGTSYTINGSPSGKSDSTYRLWGEGTAFPSGNRISDDRNERQTATAMATESTPIILQVSSGVNVDNLTFYPMVRLASVSDATFAPYSNICPITGMTEVEVERTGKNLFGGVYNEFFSIHYPVDTVICASADKRNDQYVPQIAFYDENKTQIDYWGISEAYSQITGRIARSFTLPKEAYYVRFITHIVENMQIEFGNTNSSYEPYQGTSHTIPLGRTVYGGTLDVTTGVLTVDRVGYVFTDGTNLTEGSDGDANWLCVKHTVTSGLFDTVKREQNICSYVPFTFANVNGTCHFYTTGNVFQLFVPKSTYPTLSAFTASLATSPLIYVAFLATPQTYTLTPQELLSVLGTNHISTDAESVEVVYRADIALYIENLTEPDADMIADTNITSGSYFMVGNTLYLATANIANGAAVVVGTNCVRSNLASALNAINA